MRPSVTELLRRLYTIPLRLRSLFRRRQVEQDLEDEFCDHLEQKTAGYISEGLSPEEAHRAAVRDMEGIERSKEECRDERRVNFLEEALSDLRYACRTLRRNPTFTAIAALTLALGIGATTAIYCIFYAALLAPFPYPNPDQIVVVWSLMNGSNKQRVSPADFLDWQRQSTCYQILGAVTDASFNLSVNERPEQIAGSYLTPGFLDQLIGDTPFMGRYPVAEESVPGKDHVAVLTHKLWRERFASDPNILGKQIHVNGESYTVIGVQKPGQPDRLSRQIVVPMTFPPDRMGRDLRSLVILGRLKPSVTIAQADAEIKTIARHLADAYSTTNKNLSATVRPLTREFLDSGVQVALQLLMGAVAFVLLIACANVANLLLARGAGRQKEVAVRASIGASAARLFRQFLVESLALATLGGTLGVALAWALLKGIMALLPEGALLSEADVRLNIPVLLFTLATSVIAGILFGCVPAWRASHLNLNDFLKENGRLTLGAGRPGLRRALVIAEFALALTLLAGGGLAIHSLWKQTHANFAFQTDHLLVFDLPIPQDRLKSAIEINAFYRQFLDRIQALPAVTSASAGTGLPPIWSGFHIPFQLAGQANADDLATRPNVGFQMVTPEFFRTFEVRLVKGRLLALHDTAAGLRVALVSQVFVKKFLPGVDPLTQRILVPALTPGVPKLGAPIEWQIVGVVESVMRPNSHGELLPEVYVPFAQSPWTDSMVAVRSSIEPTTLVSSVGAILQSMDPNLPMANVKTLDELLSQEQVGARFITFLFSGFASLGLLLAALGIYGVMSFTVAQRTHEIGVRMALGANQGSVVTMILREGLLLAVVGFIVGLGGSYFVARAMRAMLYQPGTIDFSALIAVTTVLLAAALFACYIPARRAANLDPIQALRQD